MNTTDTNTNDKIVTMSHKIDHDNDIKVRENVIEVTENVLKVLEVTEVTDKVKHPRPNIEFTVAKTNNLGSGFDLGFGFDTDKIEADTGHEAKERQPR